MGEIHHDEDAIRNQILEFVLTKLETRGVSQIAADDSLVASGIVDSLGVFQLVAFLEETFAIRVQDADIRLDNFETLESSVNFVLTRLGHLPGVV